MGHCVLEAIAIVKHSSYFKWVPFFLLITSPCRGVASVLLMERERERVRPPRGDFKVGFSGVQHWPPCSFLQQDPFRKSPGDTRQGIPRGPVPPSLQCLALLLAPHKTGSPANAVSEGLQRKTTSSSDLASIWVSECVCCILPAHHTGAACILIRGFCKPKAPKAAHLLSRLPTGFSKTCDSYPYLFVFPLYCFLKIRNLPDITRLFLL